jgi:hypothetical protein
MSYGSGGFDLSETFQKVLDGAAKLLAGLGGLATAVGVIFLGFVCYRLGSGATDVKPEDAMNTIETMRKVLLMGILGLGVGTTYLFWGSEILGASQLLLSAALFFAPTYLPGIVGSPNGKAGEALGTAMGAFQTAGTALGVLAICVLVVDLFTRVRNRARTGTRADHLKYGKGIKEEKGKQNVFLGKCWQLPFCREFVREKCPIYHAKVTCWKELVGCMCEESVIRNAMENKPIPKDALLAKNMIPRNNKLTIPQKKERCRNCVIYNEHLRHQYKAAVPSTVGLYALAYVALHGPLIEWMNGIVTSINKVIQQGTLNAIGSKSFQAPGFFTESLLIVFFVVALTYTLKTLEFAIFRSKF